jgi:AraC-like DNA-binding protein
MNPFSFQYGNSAELANLPHVREFVLRKNSTVKFDTFPLVTSNTLRLYYILDGKFEWLIDGKPFVLFPGDVAVVLPGQAIGGAMGFLDIGSLVWLHLEADVRENAGIILDKWSNLSQCDQHDIGKILLTNDVKVLKMGEALNIFQQLNSEITDQELGYLTRVNHLIDSLLILVARQSKLQAPERRDPPELVLQLEQVLRSNLAYQWTVEEMAALFGLGTTAFTEKVKRCTGFSPLNYLIKIRISETIQKLKRTSANVTDIALETGFYSSQHFSTTFKKFTGYTPGEFRRRNAENVLKC